MPEVIVVKSIKPQRLKVDAIVDELKRAVQAEAAKIRREYQKTTKTWTRKPKFTQLTEVGRNLTVLVGTDDEIYGYLDKGTRKNYPITPKRGPYLWFRTGYRAKTKPRVISSFAGGAFGRLTRARAVTHPGIKARRFSETIQKRRKRPFSRRIIQAVQRGAARVF